MIGSASAKATSLRLHHLADGFAHALDILGRRRHADHRADEREYEACTVWSARHAKLKQFAARRQPTGRHAFCS